MGKAKRKHAPPPPAAAPKPATHIGKRVAGFLERRSRVLAIALIALGSLRIVSTYTVFSHTSDEPAHIACGMEWLDKGVYQWEPQHPPLARVAAALGPYLMGLRSQGTDRKAFLAMSMEGVAILDRRDHDTTLAAARLGILPFFWIACWVVYVWGRRYYGPAVGVSAVFLFSFLPPVLAHAGLATTDMALTAFVGAAFVAGLIWLERPTTRNALLFGAMTGLMVLSKFSCLVFFPAAAALALAWYFVSERPHPRRVLRTARERLPSFSLAVLVGFLLIWAGYRFSFGHVSFTSLRLPAPELFAGIDQVREHNALGHESYLFGSTSMHGFWAFFPVALAVKTPLAFLALLFAGIWLVFRKTNSFARLWVPLAFSLAILVVGMFSSINIGLRHILPIYEGLSLLAAAALIRGLESADAKKWIGGLLAGLLLWFAGSSLLAHPDYLPYFNLLAGSEPEKIMVDSDLDWGQDIKRLAKRLREEGATRVAFDRYIVGDPVKEYGLPPYYRLNPDLPLEGWNALGVSIWKESGIEHWPNRIKPRERVGKSILLWYFPPAGAVPSSAPRR
jgi:Dolichyl-phosphate-mannose-protein mannosyltransferase